VWQSVALDGRVSDRIAQQILRFISAEEVKPGDRLPSERDLAVLLGVSRPSVREAVKALEAQGRLRVRHGQGVFVASQTAENDLRAALARQDLTPGELYLMREVLEVPAAGWAATNGDDERLAAMAAALDDLNLAAAATPPDAEAVQELDAAFHMRIVEATGNRFLCQTLGVLQGLLASGVQSNSLIPGRLARARATAHPQLARCRGVAGRRRSGRSRPRDRAADLPAGSAGVGTAGGGQRSVHEGLSRRRSRTRAGRRCGRSGDPRRSAGSPR
jgi:GntR family transcriptional regulator, transcriptional repressor for pyruvate dehydrogenase complex